MIVYNFKEQFAPKVETGEKRQTIRQRRRDGRKPMPRQRVRLYVGQRTTKARRIGDSTVTEVQDVQVVRGAGGKPAVLVDGKEVWGEELEQLARADGFDAVDDFLSFFPVGFEGHLVKWGDLEEVTCGT